MRSFALTLLLFAEALFRAEGQPILESGVLAEFDVNGDGAADITHYAHVSHPNDSWYVFTALIPNAGCAILKGAGKKAYFSGGDLISKDSILYLGGDGLSRPTLTYYIAGHPFQSEDWEYQNGQPPDGPGSRLSVFVGLRLIVDGVTHHGWIRFTRADLRPETLFHVDGHDWNPIPDAPIGAGLPPEIPITAEPLPGGAGIRLSWPPGLSNWILESTVSLSAPVVWRSFPAGGASADVLSVEAGCYFRLRRP